MRALITRPRAEAEATARALRARGLECLIEPLLEIIPKDTVAFDLSGIQAILVTSVNGARLLGRHLARRDIPLFAVGAKTADHLRAAGFATIETAQGGGADLARLVGRRLQPSGGGLIHATGTETRPGLGRALAAAGFAVARVILYEARAAEGLAPETSEALAKGRLDGVLLFSPRTAETFVRLSRKAGLDGAMTRLTALCLSPAVAAAARGLTWTQVMIAARPDLDAMLDLVDEWTRAAGRKS